MIKLTNYTFDNIVVHFPLLYLNGNVCLPGANIIKCRNISLSSDNNWQVVDGNFKVFTFLQEGCNNIVLSLEEGGQEVKLRALYNEPKTEKKYVLPVYIICEESDGRFIAPDGCDCSIEDAVEKIKLNMRLMQTFFAESLYEHGFSRKTFHVKEDMEHVPLIEIFKSKLTLHATRKMTPDDLYRHFNDEITSTLPNDENCKYLCFMSCTRYYPPSGDEFEISKIMSYVKGHAALGGGNMALFGTGSFFTWANNLHELTGKFSDQTTIDPLVQFDDSCGRKTYGANYSTTLGAVIHELGHCFDLAHTPHGIMARGHDDMDYFYTVKEDHTAFLNSINGNNTGKYRGAHWHRASAVVLNYHQWFKDGSENTATSLLSISFNPDVLGPLGNVGPCAQKAQENFSSHSWLSENDLNLTGIVFYHNEYLNGIQFLGAKYINENDKMSCKGQEIQSKIYGRSTGNIYKTVFQLDPSKEKINQVKIRSGAWIDSIQVCTNLKSSAWLGGQGGDEKVFNVKDRTIKSWIGTADHYVGSIALKLDNVGPNRFENTAVTFHSNHGVRLLEVRNNHGEVKHFQEYLTQSPPKIITLDAIQYMTKDMEKLHGMIFNDVGGKLNFSIGRDDLELLNE